MGEINRNPMPKFDILPHPLRKIGQAILDFFSIHQLSSHGEHQFVHPLDDALDAPAYVEHDTGRRLMRGQITVEQAFGLDIDGIYPTKGEEYQASSYDYDYDEPTEYRWTYPKE